MAEFAKLSQTDGNKFPKRVFDGQEDQSFGFTLAHKLQTGNTRGQQTVGYGGAQIDGANNRIVITNPADSTKVGIGIIPGTNNEFGFFSLDSDDNLVMKIVNGTWYVYDPDNDNENRIQSGKLPDESYGMVVTKVGTEVTDAFD